MLPTGDFKAQLGRPENPGLLNQEARLARIRPGRNPYVTGTALPGNSPVFFGREQILHEVLSVLRRPDKPGCVSLLGERRIGKSSLLNQIYQALGQEPNLVSIHATAQNWNQKSQQNFFVCLQQAIARTVSQAVQDQAQDYPGFRDFILSLAQDYNCRFVLILDEFEVMAGNPNFNADFFRNMRALGSEPEPRFGYLVSSRQSLTELCRDNKKIDESSFWNVFGSKHILGLLSEQEAQNLVIEPLHRTLPPAHQPDLKQLWLNQVKPLTGCHSALVQIVASAHWDALISGYTPDLATIRVNLHDHLKDLLIRRTKEELKVLIHAAAGSRLTYDDVLTDLKQRGLLTLDGKPFSSEFAQLIKKSFPKGKRISRALNDLKKKAEQTTGWFEKIVKLVERLLALCQKVKNLGDDKGSSSL